VSKLSSGEGRPSNSVSEPFKNAGWIGTSKWIKRSQLEDQLAKFVASSSRNYWGHQLTRSLRQFRTKARNSGRPFKPEEVVGGGQLPARFSNMDKIKYILNPVLFTAAVGTGSIVCCTIWQYEEYRQSQLNTRFSLSSLRRSVFGEPSQGGVSITSYIIPILNI